MKITCKCINFQTDIVSQFSQRTVRWPDVAKQTYANLRDTDRLKHTKGNFNTSILKLIIASNIRSKRGRKQTC